MSSSCEGELDVVTLMIRAERIDRARRDENNDNTCKNAHNKALLHQSKQNKINKHYSLRTGNMEDFNVHIW